MGSLQQRAENTTQTHGAQVGGGAVGGGMKNTVFMSGTHKGEVEPDHTQSSQEQGPNSLKTGALSRVPNSLHLFSISNTAMQCY